MSRTARPPRRRPVFGPDLAELHIAGRRRPDRHRDGPRRRRSAHADHTRGADGRGRGRPRCRVPVRCEARRRAAGCRDADLRPGGGQPVRGPEGLRGHGRRRPELRHSLTSIQALLIDTPSGDQVPLGRLANVRIGPVAHLHRAAMRSLATWTSSPAWTAVRSAPSRPTSASSWRAHLPDGVPPRALDRLGGCPGGHPAAARRHARVAIGIFLVLQAALGSWRLAAVSMVVLPIALVGGVIAAYVFGGELSLGSMIGFLAVLAIAARNELALVEPAPAPRTQRRPIRSDARAPWREGASGSHPHDGVGHGSGLPADPPARRAPGAGDCFGPMAIVVIGGLITSTLAQPVHRPDRSTSACRAGPAAEGSPSIPQAAEPQPAGAH